MLVGGVYFILFFYLLGNKFKIYINSSFFSYKIFVDVKKKVSISSVYFLINDLLVVCASIGQYFQE